MTQTVNAAVAVREQSGAEAVIEQYRDDLAMLMPTHIRPDMWVRLATSVFRRDAKLRAAAENNVGALFGALATAARLGLEPGTEQFYLTPRRAKRPDGTYQDEILGIVGYQGEIELMYRAGAVSTVIVEVVRQADKFTYAPGRDERPVHEIDWDLEDRGPLRLAYAYAIMKDGATSKVVVLNKKHIADAKESSQGADKSYSPWVKHEEAMWMKTAAHRLTKWVPTSAEYRKEQLRAAAAVAREVGLPTLPPVPAGVHADTGEVVEAEFMPEDAA
jgi:recombination protein RecT